jgi:hypothetical protein
VARPFKRAYRAHAEHVVTYGRWPGTVPDYECWYGEHLNRARAQAISAVQAFRGHLSALTHRPHPDMIDAMVDDADQAPGLARMFEASRAEAEALARTRAGA